MLATPLMQPSSRIQEPDLEILTASIDNHTPGRWLVTTQSGTRYLLNMNMPWVLRDPSPDAAGMRRDGVLLDLVQLVTCKVGEPMRLVVRVREAGVYTIRDTTPVLNIKQLGEGFLPW